MPSKALLDYHIGFRVNQEVFSQIQTRAERAGKPANAWCREKIIEATQRPRVSLGKFATLAEVNAVEEIIIELLYAIVTELMGHSNISITMRYVHPTPDISSSEPVRRP